jgi:AraC-like DNA-binding protein
MPRKAEGFSHQIHLVLPPAVVAVALRESITRDLFPPALGYFPAAAGHYVARRAGATESIAILCVDGEGWVEYRKKRSPVHAGELVILPPGEAHRYGAGPRAWTIYWCHFAGRNAGDFTALVSRAAAQSETLAATGPAVALMEGLLRTLQHGYGRIERVSAATQLAAWFGLLQQLRAEALAPGGSSATRILAVAQWIRSHLAQRVTVAELARFAGLSPSHFNTLFRQRFGYSPLDFHLRSRVQRAGELLASPAVSIAEVAAAVGYEDPLYFSRVFRRVMGMPPSAYAARYRLVGGKKIGAD